MLRETTKTCPGCGKELEARVDVCDGCGAAFDVVERGYCAHCHEVADGHDGRCSRCGGRLVDVTVDSRPRALPGAVPSPRPAPGLETRPGPATAPSPAPQQWAPPSGAAPPTVARRAGARRWQWTVWLSVVLLLIGIGGFVTANGIDSHSVKTFAEEYAALDGRDPGTTGDALDAQVSEVKAAFDDYVLAAAAVRRRHEAVTDAFNEALASSDEVMSRKLDRVMAAYRAALRRERVKRQAYFAELRSLKVEIGS